MKQLILMVLFTSSQFCNAWVGSAAQQKPYNFKFKFEAQTYEYSTQAENYEDAYQKAAQACFNHFKDGRKVAMERGVDIIDVCANPRSI